MEGKGAEEGERRAKVRGERGGGCVKDQGRTEDSASEMEDMESWKSLRECERDASRSGTLALASLITRASLTHTHALHEIHLARTIPSPCLDGVGVGGGQRKG